VAADPERARSDELLGKPEDHRVRPVAGGGGRARQAADTLLHDRAVRQPAAAPVAHARAPAPAQRLAQPAAGAPVRRGGKRARIQQPCVGQHRAQPLRLAHRAQRLRRVAQQRVPPAQPRDQRGMVLEACAVDDTARRLRRRCGDERAEAAAPELRRRHDAACAPSQVEVAEQIERNHSMTVAPRQVREHARA
jgi:hypothetical protein